MKDLYGNIRITDYSYDLPAERIARYPLAERDRSRLLVWDGREISDRVFSDLPDLADPGHLMVFNNTRVIRARLKFRKESGAAIEVFCLEPYLPADFANNLSSCCQVEWKCLIGNLKRWKQGALVSEFVHNGCSHTLSAEITAAVDDSFVVRFSWDAGDISFAELLESMGHMPIPPYLGRDDEQSDAATYQTLYAQHDGSVAAPTAGLHFTPALLDRLREKGIEKSEVTLHVSAGTFRPVKSELICDHMMHTEHFFVTRSTLERLRGRKITAVGTTTVRTLESLYWLGLRSAAGRWPEEGIPSVSQWEPYETGDGFEADDALDRLLELMNRRGIEVLEAKTDIIIVPGYRFRIVGSMITNFHQPRSTLLLLVAAFTGNSWSDIYDHALTAGYRFLSYGDSMLLTPQPDRK